MICMIASTLLFLVGMTISSRLNTPADFYHNSNSMEAVTPFSSCINSSSIAFPALDDVLVSQPYSHDLCIGGVNFSSWMDYMVADDVVLEEDNVLELVDIWLKNYLGELPASYNIGLQGATGLGPDGQWIWQSTESNVWYEPFDVFNGDTVWHAQITLSDSPLLQGPATYWFCLQAVDPDGWTYWMTALNQTTWGEELFFSYNNGVTWQPGYIPLGLHVGTFMIIQGTTSLEHNTWSRIKASF